MSKLARGVSDNHSGTTQRRLFQEQVADRAAEEWPNGGSVEEKWEVLKFALTKSAEALLGTEDRHHPDWSCESAGEWRNQLYTKWLRHEVCR